MSKAKDSKSDRKQSAAEENRESRTKLHSTDPIIPRPS